MVLLFSVGAFILPVITLSLLLRVVYVRKPNEILVFSPAGASAASMRAEGRRKIFNDGSDHWISFGQKVERLDRSLMSVPLTAVVTSNAKVHVTVMAVAHVKISSDPKLQVNAVERFLGVAREAILANAKATLEEHLCRKMGNMAPGEIHERRFDIAEEAAEVASSDLEALGLQLDLLRIHRVSDDGDYLKSIGMRRVAVVLKEAEFAKFSSEEVDSGDSRFDSGTPRFKQI